MCKFRFVIGYAHSARNIVIWVSIKNKCTNDVIALGYWVAKKPEPKKGTLKLISASESYND